LLAPYVLSSDVMLSDRTAELSLLVLPHRTGPPPTELPNGWAAIRPSSLGPGLGLVGPVSERDLVHRALQADDPGLVEVFEPAMEAWRIAQGTPRYPVDLTPESLPHETDVGEAIAYTKGCYLGQEAVARVGNLGHPPFVLLPVRSRAPVAAGDPVLADGEDAGTVTSATPLNGGGSAAIARVRWAARHATLRTATGSDLAPVTRPASSASA
jgi:folate-binding protein YgfZ